jgi:2-haloacid dehalogenase
VPRFRAVIFDLLTALIDSWTLWGDVAGDEELGAQWRRRSLEIIYATGAYRPYEEIVAEAAGEAAGELLARWDELEPWPEAPAVLRDLATDHRLALVTNTSQDLAERAANKLGVEVDLLVSAERVGFYKPRPEPYRAVLQALATDPARTLFVAGSASDVPGAKAVGMPVYWHNRIGLPPRDEVMPDFHERTLDRLVDLAHQAG